MKATETKPKQVTQVLDSVKTESKTSAIEQIKSAVKNIKLGIYLF